MVTVIQGSDMRDGSTTIGPGTPSGQGTPLVHIHLIERTIHGNHVAVKIWGELKIGAKEIIYARELKLKTLQVLLLTPEHGVHQMFVPSKNIYHKGELDNYASIDVFSATANELPPAGSVSVAIATAGPTDSSIWLNFVAVGE